MDIGIYNGEKFGIVPKNRHAQIVAGKYQGSLNLAEATASTVSHADTVGSPDTGYGSRNYRKYILGILLTVYIFNFIDRTIINILTNLSRKASG